MPDRYRCAATENLSLGDGTNLLYSKVSGAARLLAKQDADLLRFCSAYLPLDEHALEWCREQDFQGLNTLASLRLPRWANKLFQSLQDYSQKRRATLEVDPKRLQAAAQRLAELAEAGFLVSDTELIRRCRSAAQATEPLPPITTIGVPTRNRPDTLKRGLVSYIENGRRHGREVEFVILDDSNDAEAEQKNRGMLEALVREHKVSIRYAGRAARQEFAQSLTAASGAPSELIHFALFGLEPCPVTYGAACNNLLLETLGDRWVLVDDDCVCKLAPCPQPQSGLALTSQYDPTQFWFFRDRASILQSVRFEEEDFLGLHEKLLGRPIGACLPTPDPSPGVDLEGMSAEFDRHLRQRAGQIALTGGGVVGDSGVGSTAYLFVDPASQLRLPSSEEEFLEVVRNRQVLRCVTRTTISDGDHCMSANLGVDNRRLLPPFVPVQRNPDGLFARTLRKCYRDAYQSYLPWVLWHDPPKPRQQKLEAFWEHSRRMRFGDVLIQLIFSCPEVSEQGDEQQAMARLGSYLKGCAELELSEFEGLVRTYLWRAAATVINLGVDHGGPPPARPYYASYRGRYLRVLRGALPDPDYVIPQDLEGVASRDEVRRLVRRIVFQFGELLQAWPHIVQTAKDLRAQGRRLAQPL